MRRLLTLQYLGTRYAGWQFQTNGTGVQQVVEEALAAMFGATIRIEGAGRTDAGVHARGQRAHCDIDVPIDARGLKLGLNNLLPHDVRVVAVDDVAEDFHCRFAAKSKTYEYSIWNADVMDVFAWETTAHVAGRLDHIVMRDAVQRVVGHHDFAALTVANPEVQSTWRTVTEAEVERRGERLTLTISADGFLRYMVRRIAGSLIEIGRGRLDAAAILSDSRWTAPAKGLTLLSVKY